LLRMGTDKPPRNSFIQGPAPDVARQLVELTEHLPNTECARLAYGWLDRFVRQPLAEVLDKHGEAAAASAMRSLSPIRDGRTLVAVREALERVDTRNPSNDLMVAVYGAIVGLRDAQASNDPATPQALNVFEAAFIAVMMSRFVHGDDRFASMMRTQLQGQRPPDAS